MASSRPAAGAEGRELLGAGRLQAGRRGPLRLRQEHYTILYYTILYYTILYYTILYYTILYYTILHYYVLVKNGNTLYIYIYIYIYIYTIGKSTLMQALLRLLEPESGSIRVDGDVLVLAV